MLLRADARAKREQGCVPRPGATLIARRRATAVAVAYRYLTEMRKRTQTNGARRGGRAGP